MNAETAERAVKAETRAFIDLYNAGAAKCGTSTARIDNIDFALSPRDDDAGYSPVLNLADAGDKLAILRQVENLVVERGAKAFGINGNPEIDAWIVTDEVREQGYQIVDHEFFWARDLSPGIDLPTVPDGVAIEHPDPEDAGEFGIALNLGFGLSADHTRGHTFASTIGRPDWYHYLAMIDGRPACTSVLFVAADVAQLFVTTTVPEFRSRGLQTYMIRRRLADGVGFGCKLAICQTVVDNSSPRNMARQGFELLYKRGIIEKQL